MDILTLAIGNQAYHRQSAARQVKGVNGNHPCPLAGQFDQRAVGAVAEALQAALRSAIAANLPRDWINADRIRLDRFSLDPLRSPRAFV